MFEQEDIKWVDTDDGEENKVSIMFAWGIEKFGFGTTTFYYDGDKLMCDNEAMSKEMIKKILCAFVDKAEFIDEKN